MSPTISRLITVCLPVLMLFSAYGAVRAQGVGKKPLRVLVDASKSGGQWWFPQGPNFNPKEYHQGKGLVDFMRGTGWHVVEAMPGEVITFDRLRDFDLVIRPQAYYTYSVDEVKAYEQSITAGTRLLLMGGGSTDNDSIAHIFGLHFETRSRFAPVKRWIPNALTTNIDCCSTTWTSISEMPAGAVALAWLNPLETNTRPILGYLPYGQGYVVFIGQSFIVPAENRSFRESLIKSVAHYPPEEIAQHLVANAVVKEELGDLGPRLLDPIAEATLPQPASAVWRFEWEDVPSAKGYEIVVLGPSAIVPILRTYSDTSKYAMPSREGYIADMNLKGWSWRVRAQYQNGSWGPWSRIRRFNVRSR